jgi:thioredoxin reductase (NADPH)
MENIVYDTLIIGSGPAGLTAGIYNIRANLKTLVIAGNQPGGQLTITTTVDNYPGFPNGTGGIKLMMDMQAQFKNLGGEIATGIVNKLISKSADNNFEIHLVDGKVLKSKSVIVATGATIKWLGLPKEKELTGKGVSGCATCDGMFFKDKIVAVIGGGDTACEEADFLTRLCKKVYLIHRRDALRASAVEQKKVLNNPKIEMIWNTEVIELNPSKPLSPTSSGHLPLKMGEQLTSIKLKNTVNGEERVLEIDGMFVAVGYQPSTEFLEGFLELDEHKQVLTGKNEKYPTMTSVEGVFAAGDCVNENHRQAIIAAGDGCRAGLDAERWLNE